jgi:hypothetical protein
VRRTKRSALLAPLLLLPLLCGCMTQALWNELPKRHDCGAGAIDWSNGRTVATVALTPLALAGDAAIVTLYVWAVAESHDGWGCRTCCR